MFKLIIAAAFVISSAFVLAETPSYNYISAGYSTNIGGDADFDGFGISVSKELTNNIFVLGGYSWTDIDKINGIPNATGNGDSWEAGIGFQTGITESTSLFALVTYQDVEFKVKFKLADQIIKTKDGDTGYEVGIGSHTYINDKIEIEVGAYYYDVGTTDEIYGDIAITYNFTELFGVYFNVSGNFSEGFVGLGARYYFN